jgi:hypothetical protein
MKKLFSLLLLAAFLLCAATALAQTVPVPQASVVLTLPDTFTPVPPSPGDDRSLILQLSDGTVDLAVYVSYAGTGTPFLVLTGDETEYGPVTINGMEMQYTRGNDESGAYASYSWLRGPDSVTLYFVWSGNDTSALRLISEIMNSISPL